MIDTRSKIVTQESAADKVNRWKKTGSTVVFTNGCFDLLHPGHIRYLESARNLGDRLVLGLNDDESVRRLKGHQRPILPIEDRAEILAGLEAIDLVVPFHEDTPRTLIILLRPDILVKGGDYRISEIAGADEVQSWGGKVKVLEFVAGKSTTSIIDRIRKLV